MIIVVLYAVIITPADPEPYHTSIFSGEMWVQELLNGHPDHILCELGVQKEVFKELICTLHNIGTMDSKHISLEEQLAIFLYISVTGLTIRHTGEQFQHSNDTISKYFHKMLFIFLSGPFYTDYVNLPDANTPSLVKNTSQSQDMAIFPTCTWSHRWQSHPMHTTNNQMHYVPQPQRLSLPELPFCVFI